MRGVKDRTREDYERQAVLAEPCVGRARLDLVEPDHLKALYDALEQRLSPVLVMKVHRVLRIAFRRAVRPGYVAKAVNTTWFSFTSGTSDIAHPLAVDGSRDLLADLGLSSPGGLRRLSEQLRACCERV